MVEDMEKRTDRRTSAAADEPRLDLANLAEIAAWIATAAASGIVGNAAFAYVDNFRRRFGERRIGELKDRVYKELKRVKRKPHVSDADLRLRVERLFEDDGAG